MTTVQTSCQIADLENPQHDKFTVFDIPDKLIVTNSVNSGIGRPELSAVFSAAVCILPSRVRVNPR